MPIFEYRCQDCGHVSSFLEKATAKGVHLCQKCASKKTQKIFSSFSASVKVQSKNQGCFPSCATGQCPGRA